MGSMDSGQVEPGLDTLPSALIPPPAPSLPGKAERSALRILQAGAVAVVLIASTYRAFELDRYFVPKELTLHLTALSAGLLTVRAFRRTSFGAVDLLLLGYLALGAISAVTAQNGWLGLRALAVSASGIAIFWAARSLREAGLARPLVTALAVAVVLGALASLLQTYGVRTDFFSINRAPGGTLGNRNFVAHTAAFGLPIVLLTTLRASKRSQFLLGLLGLTVVTACLVLTRSRAAWLAFGAVLVVVFGAMMLSPQLRRHRATWRRLAISSGLATAGVAAALLIPNTLRWRSDNPYLESITGVANFQEGSGAGRLVQYRQSFKMLMTQPILGVGPGNWPVAYPAHAARRDPSMNRSEPGTTSNPWPSSDWVAFAAERGLPAAMLLALALLGVAWRTLRQLVRARDADEGLAAATLLATLLAASVAGAFDAVLLLALPTLLVWAALGALWPPTTRPFSFLASRAHGFALIALALIAGLGAARSTAQLIAMAIYAEGGNTRSLANAARIDPGNYRVRLRLARGGSGLNRAQRCRHARAAHELLPNANEARDLSRPCGRR